MIRRAARNALERLSGQFPVVAVMGPRQSGKTTLVKEVFPDKRYVSFDDIRVRRIATDSPNDFLSAFPDGVIIDEVQKVPEIFDSLKLSVDSNAYSPGKYILTGSSQFRLRENITDSLAGRVGIVRLLPLSISELKSEGRLASDPYAYAFNGFYPPFYDDNKSLDRVDWFDNYIDSYIDLDIKDKISHNNIAQFRKLVQLCAFYSGGMMNFERIACEIGVSSVTVKSWIGILEQSFIVHLLTPDYENLGKSIVKTPKMYFVDTGLLCHLLRIRSREDLLLSDSKGAVVEAMAVSELLKLRFNRGRRAEMYFFRDRNGFEVDVIGKWESDYAIEVKSNSVSESKASSSLRKYIYLKGRQVSGKVFYLGDFNIMSNSVEYVSWKNWGEI